ncbi:hypothetical protein [Candidatus Viadribacter manganicus]|uniref:Uncharacterized protein n=1 Tax=Candidatus Viadribacter manganicus TaxID=1759059 RepID=A0A1B1AEI0_9PROT|nr:hypothetical protein [Candidatus Viadribacter manganicus]ANP44955.1 hypothetical protein ATE48_02955 [Candidatus Viadribacter manganicus]
MKPRDKLLAGLGLGATALLCAYTAHFIYAIVVAVFFTVSPEAQSQGNWWLANGLSTSIETALGDDAPATLANNCSPPMEGLAPAPECIFVRGASGGPGCKISACWPLSPRPHANRASTSARAAAFEPFPAPFACT